MDINFSDADLAFRDEVREFLAQAWDDTLQAQYSFGGGDLKAAAIEWQQRLYR